MAKTQRVQDVFDSLVTNAIDFFEHALSEIDKEPKYSVIHFCSGLEIFLKARLVLEHWALIVENDTPNYDSFRDGHSFTVGMERALNLIKGVTGTSLSKELVTCFKAVSEHRNRLVHFFHKQDKKTIADIAGEQCKAWYFLYQLLTDEWKEEFHLYQQKIEELNASMLENRRFLEEKFQLITPKLTNLSQQKKTILVCKFCHFEAAEVGDSEQGLIADVTCHICEAETNIWRITCPKCNMVNYHQFGESVVESECEYCSHELMLEHLMSPNFVEAFEATSVDTKDLVNAFGTSDYDLPSPAYCLSCRDEESPSAYAVNNRWFCFSCYEWHDVAGFCEWCNEPIAGYTDEDEDTYTFGCGIFECSGSLGYVTSKDD